MDVGRKVRQLRRVQDLSQDDLAARVGVSRNSISRFETGARMPSIEMLEKLASALGVRASDLLAEESTLPKASAPSSSTIEDEGRREDIREFLDARTGTGWIVLPEEEWEHWWQGVPREEVLARYHQIEEEWRLLKYELDALGKGQPSILKGIIDNSAVWGELQGRAIEARFSVPRREESDQEFQRRRLEDRKQHSTYYEPLEADLPADSEKPREEKSGA